MIEVKKTVPHLPMGVVRNNTPREGVSRSWSKGESTLVAGSVAGSLAMTVHEHASDRQRDRRSAKNYCTPPPPYRLVQVAEKPHINTVPLPTVA